MKKGNEEGTEGRQGSMEEGEEEGMRLTKSSCFTAEIEYA